MFYELNLLFFKCQLTFDGTVKRIISLVRYIVVAYEVKVHLIGTGHHVARISASRKRVKKREACIPAIIYL